MLNQYISIFLIGMLISCITTKPSVVNPVEPPAPPIFNEHAHTKITQHPKNIILMIGDGMGVSQITAGLYSNNNRLNIERFKQIGFQKTHCSSSLITDSAAGATAMACGKKTYRGAIGVDKDTTPIVSILELAEANNMNSGMVVTSTIVHATPAGFASHNRERHNYEEIAVDFVNHDVDILIGGGIKYFNRRKKDDRNLISEFTEKGYQINTYLEAEIENISIPNDKNFIYFTADDSPLPVSQGRSYLKPASIKTIKSLDARSNNGFFMMIEGSQIDWGGHSNNGEYIISEMIDFDQTIGSVLDWAEKDGETLVIVTSDHETGGFAVNKGSELGNLKFGFTTKKHTAAMVPVFAYGPGSHEFQGVYENTEIFYKMKKLLGFDTND